MSMTELLLPLAPLWTESLLPLTMSTRGVVEGPPTRFRFVSTLFTLKPGSRQGAGRRRRSSKPAGCRDRGVPKPEPQHQPHHRWCGGEDARVEYGVWEEDERKPGPRASETESTEVRRVATDEHLARNEYASQWLRKCDVPVCYINIRGGADRQVRTTKFRA
ncbi:hypothetical protein L1887_54934 [Cichorium endivia]|nr:hypothetical protein L1887_54934 [Cichorium endivia]